jgi:hypothetical protein
MILREAHTPKKLEHQKNQSSNIKKIGTHTLEKSNKQKSNQTSQLLHKGETQKHKPKPKVMGETQNPNTTCLRH